MPEGDITVIVCGVKCDHVWTGPQVELTREEHGIDGATLTCSKCGRWAIDVSLMESV